MERAYHKTMGANMLVRGQFHKVVLGYTFSKLCQIVNINSFYNSLVPTPSNLLFYFVHPFFMHSFIVPNKIWNEKIRDLWASSSKEERREKEKGEWWKENIYSIVIKIKVIVLIIFIKVSIHLKPKMIFIPAILSTTKVAINRK